MEITIEPTHVDILSYAGPDRSISKEAIKEARKLKARRYRNRRLGDFLKELGLTEGRATGIPTIQRHLKLNGNAPAIIETDDDRTYFLITIPCREDMVGQSDMEMSNHDSEKTIFIIEQLKKELVKKDLQVYFTDNESINISIFELANLISQVYLQVWKESVDRQAFLISEVLKMFLRLGNKNLTLNELLAYSNMESLYKLRKYLLAPAISAGYIEMSNPEKPRSSKQRYMLTPLGQNLFGE